MNTAQTNPCEHRSNGCYERDRDTFNVIGERLQGLGAVLKRCAGTQVVGNVQLSEKFVAASALMKRDIVFAASLYLEA